MFKPNFPGIVHCIDGGVLWASRREKIYRSKDGGQTWQFVLRLPISPWAMVKSRTRLSSRLTRMMVYHLKVVQEQYLSVLGFGRFFCFDLQQNHALLAQGPLQGKRPLALCKTNDQRLLYGEYRGNPERTPVSIWESRDGGCSWSAVHTLRNVRHIHGIFQDPYNDSLWFTTGDEDHECAIWNSSADFSKVEKIVQGGQQARAITLQFTADRVFFGTDTPLERNFLYGFSRSDPEPKKITEVDGSVFFSCRVGQEMFFSTACEPSTVNTAGCSSVYKINGDGESSRVASWQKDIWPMKLFQYGQVFFAAGQDDEKGLWVTPFATRQDQHSQYLSLEKETEE